MDIKLDDKYYKKYIKYKSKYLELKGSGIFASSDYGKNSI
jgi:hypothetical protein